MSIVLPVRAGSKLQEARIKQEQRAGVIDQLLNEANKTRRRR
jgi:hypothetical protein